MTVQEDAKEDVVGSEGRKPKLASISTKGLFTSFRQRGDDIVSTPDSATPKTKASGYFSSTPRTPVPVSPSVPSILAMNVVTPLRNKLLTPSRTFSRLRDEREEISRLTPSPPSPSFRDGFSLPLVGEVKPKYLLELAKEWLRNPKNLALLFWGIAVGVSGAILFMVMVGMLDHVLPTRNARNTWFEVSNQIINALFTLMCVYLHPQRFLHLHMLWRWKPSDVLKLRSIYCKGGVRKPNEWAHMLVVVLLLHLNCFAQYALCGLNWGYRRAQRPAIGVAVCLCLSIGGAAGAGIYNIVSPLGKDFETESEENSDELEKGDGEPRIREFTARTKLYRMLERRKSFACRRQGSIVEKPEWKGGLFHCTSDPPVSILTTFCGFCVFGWNMDRLGFGNRFVHIVTFVLICTAPFWIFDLAALNIQNRVVRHAVGSSGIVLCAFGLLYGGYWRIRMRERFKLPANEFCCGKPSVTDCFQWLFFPLCSLCQEVRTAESYEVRDDKFYTREHRDRASPPLGSPPPGLASPHTPRPTLSSVQEQPDSLNQMSFEDVEAIAHDNPYRETRPNFNDKYHLVPPTPVKATRDQFYPPPPAGSESPLGVSSSPSHGISPSRAMSSPKNPFVNPDLAGSFNPRASPNENPFLKSVLVGGVTESPPRTSTSNPFLNPDLYSRDSSPIRSPHRLSASYNPFIPPDMSSVGDSGFVHSPLRSPMRSPLRSPHLSPLRSPLNSPNSGRPAVNPFSPPEISSNVDEGLYTSSPLRSSSTPTNSVLQPETAIADAISEDSGKGRG